jgi:penicillin amidase
MTPRRLASLLGLGVVSSLLAGCALITSLPRPTTLAERLAAFPTRGLPLEGRVVVYWNDRQVPFIEAETDADAAFALGLVHAHLRLGQMEILRRIARGRIAEMGGPLATDIDHGLRILNFARAVDEIEKNLSEEARVWLENFVSGVNHYQGAVAELPHEYAVLGLDLEPWTVGDVLTIGRLAGSDVNWLVWGGIMALRQRPDWPELWARLVANGSASLPSFDAKAGLAVLGDIVAGLGRSGSNSMAIGPARTATGAAIMANDPHLGIMVPNTWLIVGVKSPSHHAVGLMGPGLPVFAIGRNPSIAWGGTNMRAAASELLDISGLGADEVTERRERIAVRWWFDREVTVRETRYGPVISDAPLFDGLELPDFALLWTGHQASDEVGAMLAVARARSFAEFRDAFATFAVPGQNMLYADEQGNIGQVMAVRLPVRDGPPPADIILDPAEREPLWAVLRGAGELPVSVNPERGFLVSANNRPADTDIQIGYFFSPDDRVERMAELLAAGTPLSVEDVMHIQRDVFMPSSVALREVLVAKIGETGLAAEASPAQRAALARIAGWDGHYRLDSLGAVAFERFRDAFTGRFYASAYGETDWQAFANVGRIKSLMIEDIEAADLEALRAPLRAGLERAAAGLDSFAGWGDMHRLRLAHPLANVPLIGGRYRFAEIPVAGSTDTIMKTAHRTTSERHSVRYGSNARHVSDMSDMDRNFFVLLGGQDGWFNSTTFLDQVPLWLAGEYIEVPLRIETVRATFAHRLELSP